MKPYLFQNQRYKSKLETVVNGCVLYDEMLHLALVPLLSSALNVNLGEANAERTFSPFYSRLPPLSQYGEYIAALIWKNCYTG